MQHYYFSKTTGCCQGISKIFSKRTLPFDSVRKMLRLKKNLLNYSSLFFLARNITPAAETIRPAITNTIVVSTPDLTAPVLEEPEPDEPEPLLLEPEAEPEPEPEAEPEPLLELDELEPLLPVFLAL